MNNSGFFCLPRSLTRDPIWTGLSLIQQKVFLVVLDHVCYQPQKIDDFGVIIDLEPGQVCTTIRQLVDWCDSKEITKNDVERSIKKLILCQILRQEVRHKKSILTILHSDTYDLIKKKNETRNETNLRQTRDKLETQKNKENKENKEKKILSSDSIEYGLSDFFLSLILKRNPNFKKPDLHSWAKHIDRMIRLDKRTPEDIRKVMEWIDKDHFESTVVLSTDKLRKRFDSLLMKSKQMTTQQAKNSVSQENKEISLKVFREYQSKVCELKINESDITFIPTQGQQLPFSLKYSENGFQDQLKINLHKKGFNKI